MSDSVRTSDAQNKRTEKVGASRLGSGVDGRRINLVRLAEAHRYVRVLILGSLLVLVPGLLVLDVLLPKYPQLSGIAPSIVLVLWVSLTIAMVVCTTRMARAYGFQWLEAPVIGLLVSIPCLGLISAILLTGHVSTVLKRSGVRVGLLGVNNTEMLKLRVGVCRGCGYDLRGLLAPICPECGKAIEA